MSFWYHGGNIKDFPIGKTEITNKRKLLIEELSIVKKKKADEQSFIKGLKSDSDKFVLQAGETSDVAEMRSLVLKASSLKKTAEKKEKRLPGYASSIERMEEEIKQLK